MAPFQKGHAPTPGAGRPRSGESFRDIYTRLLSEMEFDAPDAATKKLVKITAKEMLARLRIARALKGNGVEQTLIENRVDGTPAETLTVEGGGDGLKIIFEAKSAEEMAAHEGIEIVDAPPELVEPESPGAGSTGT